MNNPSFTNNHGQGIVFPASVTPCQAPSRGGSVVPYDAEYGAVYMTVPTEAEQLRTLLKGIRDLVQNVDDHAEAADVVTTLQQLLVNADLG